MADNFYKVKDHLIINEGGYVNHPMDPGGRTIYGVTWRNWIAHLKRYGKHEHYISERWQSFISPDAHGEPYFNVELFKVDDFKALQPSDVNFFYFKEYWEPSRAQDLPDGIDYYVFDFAVNSGVRQAVKILQRIVGSVDDGIIGENTLAAVNGYVERNGPKRLLKELDRSRREFLSRLKNAPYFLKGWNNRLNKVMAKCYELIGEVHIVTAKPLDKSKTIKAAKNQAKFMTAGGVVGGLGAAAGEQGVMNATEALVGKLETVSALTRVIHGLFAYGWWVIILGGLVFSAYFAWNRYGDHFLGKD